MTIEQIKKELNKPAYAFLKENEHLGSNVVLLTLGGSHAYGMAKEGSDIDIRGVAANSKREILLGKDFEQVTDKETDTVVYSLNKMLELLSKNNPNTLEILGCKPEHYLYVTDIGQALLDNAGIFLSKLCIHTFAGYAEAQLRRLENKAVREVGQAEREAHVLRTIEHARYSFKEKYFPLSEYGKVDLFLDRAVKEGLDSEIFMDIHLDHYPLRDYVGM